MTKAGERQLPKLALTGNTPGSKTQYPMALKPNNRGRSEGRILSASYGSGSVILACLRSSGRGQVVEGVVVQPGRRRVRCRWGEQLGDGRGVRLSVMRLGLLSRTLARPVERLLIAELCGDEIASNASWHSCLAQVRYFADASFSRSDWDLGPSTAWGAPNKYPATVGVP